MKWLVRIAIAMGVVMLLLVVVGLILPKDFTVERSIVIDASPAEVHRYVGDLERWADWEPFRDSGEGIEVTLGEQTTGVGASQSWTDETGGGRLTFTASDPATGVDYDLFFGEDDEMTATAGLGYAEQEAATEVTWTMSGTVPDPIFGGYLILLFDDMLEPLFDEGLTKLKAAVESRPAPEPRSEPLAVGDQIPAVTLRDADGALVALDHLVAKQPSILIFYRGGWCPYCTKHLAELGAGYEQIAATGWQVVGISPEPPATVAESVASQDLPYRLLSDADASAIRAFGVAFTVDEATRARYAEHGIDLGDHHQLPHPAVYLVDRDGVVRYAHHDPDYKQRLRLVQVLSAIGLAADEPAPTSPSDPSPEP